MAPKKGKPSVSATKLQMGLGFTASSCHSNCPALKGAEQARNGTQGISLTHPDSRWVWCGRGQREDQRRKGGAESNLRLPKPVMLWRCGKSKGQGQGQSEGSTFA